MPKPLKLTAFLNSKWVELARRRDAEEKVRKQFHKWAKKAKNTELVKRATKLWDYFNSGKVSGTEKILIVAALLYLISPVDLVPDWIPIAGLLDDVTIAGLVLDYVLKQMDEKGDARGKVGPILNAVKKVVRKSK